MKKRVFLFPTAVFLGTACLLSGCGKKSATDNAGEVYVYNWGTVGILYNTSMVAPEDVPTKWADLWDEKFKGEILMQDSVRDKMNFEYITYATPNKGAFDLLDEEIQNNKAVFPDIDSLENCKVFQYLGDDVDFIYNDLWKEVKSN